MTYGNREINHHDSPLKSMHVKTNQSTLETPFGQRGSTWGFFQLPLVFLLQQHVVRLNLVFRNLLWHTDDMAETRPAVPQLQWQNNTVTTNIVPSCQPLSTTWSNSQGHSPVPLVLFPTGGFQECMLTHSLTSISFNLKNISSQDPHS